MCFTYKITLNDPLQRSQDAVLLSNVQASLDAWSRYVSGAGSIEVEINVTTLGAGVLAQAGPGAMVFAGTDGARTLLQSGVVAELTSGVDPNGSAPDIRIDVSGNLLASAFYLNPDPHTPSTVPARSYDAITILTHEIGHGFGIVGQRDASSGVLPPNSESTWDRLVTVGSDGSAVFTGTNAIAAYGGPIPVTTLKNGEQYYHFGNGAADGVSQDLLGGTGLLPGQARAISALDIAALQDLGAPVIGASIIGNRDTGWQIDAVYKAVLQRSAAPLEQSFWLAQEATGLTPLQLRGAIEGSHEVDLYVDPIVRLYGVAFGRVPDKGGLSTWVNGLHTTSLATIASGFTESSEFSQLHGGSVVTDPLLQSFYLNALGRSGSAAELDNWKATGASAAQVLVGFSDSAEYQARSQQGVTSYLSAAANGLSGGTGSLVGWVTAAEDVPMVGLVAHSGVSEGMI